MRGIAGDAKISRRVSFFGMLVGNVLIKGDRFFGSSLAGLSGDVLKQFKNV